MNCKHKQGNTCTIYKRDNPPEHICEMCNHHEEPVIENCNKYIYDKDWCLTSGDYYTWRPRNEHSCAKCDWKNK